MTFFLFTNKKLEDFSYVSEFNQNYAIRPAFKSFGQMFI